MTARDGAAGQTFTGNRALMLEEPLIFEIGSTETTGVDFPDGDVAGSRLGDLTRKQPIGLPGLAEPETIRHYTRLSRQNYAIDLGLFPLGSCTMKHNPRLNERVARMPGFADVHPLQPVDTVQGALGVINELAVWLIKLTGMYGVAMSPKAGAHGELCGILCIKAALEKRGEGHRKVVLVPESAHGTNPATAAFAGFTVEDIPATPDGRIDTAALEARLGPDVAAVMITNPNTCGLFERDLKRISDAVHAAGGYVYCDGANFNAIVGRVRPGDLGVDAMHINLHKTSTPHGGGGPGSGPVVLSEALAPFGPLPFTARMADGHIQLIEEETAGDDHPDTFGRMTAFHGQMGMFTRALTYILSHGADGLRQVAEDAVLNANYVLRSLEGTLDAPFAKAGPCMHEAIFSDANLAEGFDARRRQGADRRGLPPDDGLLPARRPWRDAGGADRDRIEGSARPVHRRAAQRGGAGEGRRCQPEDRTALRPRARLDETLAARKPVLVWKEHTLAAAAE